MDFSDLLDGNAVGQTTSNETATWELLDRDLPRLERNTWKNYPHVDDTRARRIGRRPCSGSQEERSAGVRNEEQSSAAVQAAYSKANLHLV